jgi:hypothetical protein
MEVHFYRLLNSCSRFPARKFEARMCVGSLGVQCCNTIMCDHLTKSQELRLWLVPSARCVLLLNHHVLACINVWKE